jgi:hypothetical protein
LPTAYFSKDPALLFTLLHETTATMEKIKTSLQLKDEIDLHRKGWIAQRIGWAVLLLLVIAAAAGVFGTGWLSSRHISREGTQVTFERLARFEAPMKLIIHAQKTDGNVEIRFPLAYLEEIEVDRIVPEPAEQQTGKGYMTFTFKADPSSAVIFYLVPESAGSIRTEMAVNNTVFHIAHFIYP